MKKYISLFLIITFLSALLTPPVYGVSDDIVSIETITLDDGGCLEIVVLQSTTRATRSGNKYYTYKDANGSSKWKATLSATFTYDGTTSTCTSSSCSVAIYDSAWALVSKHAYRSGNTATGSVTMSYSTAGVTISKSTYKITLACNKNETLS